MGWTYVTLLVLLWIIGRVAGQCKKDGSQLVYKRTHQNITTVKPQDFLKCLSAVTVDLSSNAIIYIANETFLQLYNVKHLDISHNKLNILPSGLLETQMFLVVFNVSNNAIGTIPSGFFSNKNSLTVVDLSGNKIHTLPIGVFKVPYLRNVDLSHNNIVAFEPWPYYGQYDSIETFDLSWNQISTFSNAANWIIPVDKHNSQSIALIDMRYNALSIWHDGYLLQYFNDTDSQSIDVLLGQWNLDIRQNPWTCDCNIHHLTKLMKTSIYKNKLPQIRNIVCEHPASLHGKSIFQDIRLEELVCDVMQDCPINCTCEDIPELSTVKVDCNACYLTRLPDTVPFSLYNDVQLYLDDNNIEVLEERNYTKYLSILSLFQNRLITIEADALHGMSNVIRYLDLRGNLLQSVPREMQVLSFDDVQLSDNPLKCGCSMTWMAAWINTVSSTSDQKLECENDSKDRFTIANVNDDLLQCVHEFQTTVIIISSLILTTVVILGVAAKRCPYETKVLLFRVLNIHPSDKYKVDTLDGMEYDLYVSCDDEDVHVMQWIRRTLAKRLEDYKPFYKLFIPLRDLKTGIPEADARIEMLEKSRRMVVILTEGYMLNEWNEYEIYQSDTLENNDGRIMYILYDQNAVNISKRDPWRSKMEGRKVFCPNERLFWSKLRYELPLKK